MIYLYSLSMPFSSFSFNYVNQIIVGLFLWILHRKRQVSRLHNLNDHILCLSISLRLIFLGLSQSSKHDSGLSIIIPLALLLCLFILRIAGYSASHAFRHLSLLRLFRLFFASSVSSIPLVSSLSEWSLCPRAMMT
jgi:uncharacterized membrane protein